MNPTPLSNAALVVEAQNGASWAMEELVTRWLPQVLDWCRHIGGTAVHPEDATQEVFLIVTRRLVTLRSPEAFPSWLASVTRGVIVSHRRRAWIRRWIPGLQVELVDQRPDPLACAELSARARLAQTALETLPLAQREVLVLCDMEERTAAEVAALTGTPLGTVKSRLRLARRRFHREVEAMRQAVPDPSVAVEGS